MLPEVELLCVSGLQVRVEERLHTAVWRPWRVFFLGYARRG